MRFAPGGLKLFGLICVVALLTSCGQDKPAPAETAKPSPLRDKSPEPRPRATPSKRLPPLLKCPTAATNCASARGRILYVEAVDPDGDGDAHFALLSRPGITLPGVTVIDVGPHLRPDPLPRPGDYMSAVGPVYPGSRGQAQIEATAIRVKRRG